LAASTALRICAAAGRSRRTIILLRSRRVAVWQQDKKWSNPGKMLRARTRQENDPETMKELINTIVQKTGISQENADKAAQATIGFLKTKMPASFATQLDSFLSGSGLPPQTGDFRKSKVGEVVGANA
jgi:hypothetical protein